MRYLLLGALYSDFDEWLAIVKDLKMRSSASPVSTKEESNQFGPVDEGRVDSTPLYRQIHGSICTQIESGQLKIGDKLPSERTLAKTFSVSLMTARHALSELEREGKIERRHAVGSFVRAPQIQFNKLEGLAQQLASKGIDVQSVVLSLRKTRAEYEIAARLALPTNHGIMRLERLRLGGGEPIALECAYFAVERSQKIRRGEFAGPSMFGLLEKLCGDEPAYADEEIDATSADQRVSELLRVPVGAPLLRSRQTLASSSGRPLVFALSLYDRVTLSVRRYR